MDISYLEEFLVIVEEGRLGEAAERLYTTSSSLSKHIHALEKEYGVPLFDRTKRTISLNEYGRILLPYAEKMVRLHQETRKKIQKKASTERSVTISAGYRIFEMAVDFRHKTNISLNIDESYDGKQMLLDEKCDLAFIVDEENREGNLVRVPYMKDDLVMVCHKSHPLARRKKVSLAELQDEDFIMFPSSDQNRISKIIKKTCKEGGLEPKIVFNGTVGSTILDAVSKNMGISLLWKKALQFIMKEDITIVPLDPRKEIDISLFYLKDRKLTEEAEMFVEFVKEKAENAE